MQRDKDQNSFAQITNKSITIKLPILSKIKDRSITGLFLVQVYVRKYKN